jgi:hypothetical protein
MANSVGTLVELVVAQTWLRDARKSRGENGARGMVPRTCNDAPATGDKTDCHPLMAGPAPCLTAPLLRGGTYPLAEHPPERFMMVVLRS